MKREALRNARRRTDAALSEELELLLETRLAGHGSRRGGPAQRVRDPGANGGADLRPPRGDDNARQEVQVCVGRETGERQSETVTQVSQTTSAGLGFLEGFTDGTQEIQPSWCLTRLFRPTTRQPPEFPSF
jgi:hypothetical protein